MSIEDYKELNSLAKERAVQFGEFRGVKELTTSQKTEIVDSVDSQIQRVIRVGGASILLLVPTIVAEFLKQGWHGEYHYINAATEETDLTYLNLKAIDWRDLMEGSTDSAKRWKSEK